MKKIIYLVLISLISFTGFSQVSYDNMIVSKYLIEYDYDKQKYIEGSSQWLTIIINPFEDYFYFIEDESEDEGKVWWEYNGFNDDLEGDV